MSRISSSRKSTRNLQPFSPRKSINVERRRLFSRFYFRFQFTSGSIPVYCKNDNGFCVVVSDLEFRYETLIIRKGSHFSRAMMVLTCTSLVIYINNPLPVCPSSNSLSLYTGKNSFFSGGKCPGTAAGTRRACDKLCGTRHSLKPHRSFS